MSLYYEAASLIMTLGSSQDTSLKSLLFSKTKSADEKPRKSKPGQLYALVTESWKWGSVLKEVIEKSGLLVQEKKLTPQLALVLVHDLLLSKKGIAAPESHGLRQAVDRHKARLKSEFIRARIRHCCATVDELRVKLQRQESQNQTRADAGDDQDVKKWSHPRWLRINLLKAQPEKLLREEFIDWKTVETLQEVIAGAGPQDLIYHIDKHVPDLLAVPAGIDLTSLAAYKRGELISQDKASCFPAYLLGPGDNGMRSILDGCAAPGNKTSHIAAIVSNQHNSSTRPARKTQIYATERSSQRAETLTKMLNIAGADHVKVLAGQDFFQLNINEQPWSNITDIILDPSCSGSGIVDRGQIMTFDLPSAAALPQIIGTTKKHKSKKRKLNENNDQDESAKPEQMEVNVEENDVEITESNTRELEARLRSLAGLQTKMLTFAFSFPMVQRITYSTCSIHDVENEGVVAAALSSATAQECGWRILKRDEQVDGMRRWERRGRSEAFTKAMAKQTLLCGETAAGLADACIRCEPFTIEGTQGFFVAGFVRDMSMQSQSPNHPAELLNGDNDHGENGDEEWGGFTD